MKLHLPESDCCGKKQNLQVVVLYTEIYIFSCVDLHGTQQIKQKCHQHTCCIFQRFSSLFQSFVSFKTNRLLCTSCITFDPTLIPSFIFHHHSSFPLCSSPYCLNAKAHNTMSPCIDLFVLIASHKTLRFIFFSCSPSSPRVLNDSGESARHVGKTFRDKEQRAKLNIIFNQ